MLKHEINIYLEPKLTILIKKSWFINIINRILNMLNVTTLSELGLVLTNNEVIQKLNKTYRKKDEPTDVLAFYVVSSQDAKATKFVTPPDGISHLGEIVISYPQAVYQADERKHDIKRELMILVIHGVLHLLGYDHERSAKEEQRMHAKEKEILDELLSSC